MRKLQSVLAGPMAMAIAMAVAGCCIERPIDLSQLENIPPPIFTASTPSTVVGYQGGILVSNFQEGEIGSYDAEGKFQGRLAFMNFQAVARPVEINGEPGTKMRAERERYPAGCMALAGYRLFVMQIFSGNVLAMNPRTGALLMELPLGHEGAMCASADGKFLYCATMDKGMLSIVDTRTLEFEQVPLPEDTKGPSAIAVSADGKKLFIGMQRANTREGSEPRKRGVVNGPVLLVYDLAEREYVTRTPLTMDDFDGESHDAGIPSAMLVSPDGKTLFIGMFQSEAGIITVDTQTNKVSGNIPFDSHNQHFKWADPLALAIVGDRMLVLLRNNSELAAIDWKTRERLGTWPLKHDGSRGHHGIGVTAEKVIVDNGGVDVFNLSEIFRYQRAEQEKN